MLARFPCFLAAMLFVAPAVAAPVVVQFTAVIQSGVDMADLFQEGANADLAGQLITGSVSIEPEPMVRLSADDGSSFADFGAGAVSVAATIHGVTVAAVSSGTLGYYGGRSGGEVSIEDLADGGYNYMDAGATTADGMMQESISALFGPSVALSAASIDSLYAIGTGSGLTAGGFTLMTAAGEHITAAMLFMSVPEPAPWSIFLLAIAVLLLMRNRCFPADRLLVADTCHDR